MIKRLLATLLAFLSFAVFAAVDVNKGTAAELDGVKGIGPAISTKIVDERKKGNFKDWSDLITRVNGIGDKNAVKLSEGGLTVNGSAFSGAATPAKAAAKPAMADKSAVSAKPAMADKPATAAPAAAPAADAKADAKAEKKAKAQAKAEAKAQAKADKAAMKADKAAAAASAAKK